MRAATSPFVALLLGDDLWAPEAVAVLTAAIRTHPDTDFFHSSRRVIDEQDRPLSSVHRSRAEFALTDFVAGSPVKHLLCWRRAKGLAVGGLDESLNSVGPDDYDFPWTMAEHGARFIAIEACLYIYRDHRDGFRLTTHLTLPHHLRELDRILAKHGVDSAERARRLAAARRGFLRQCLYRSQARSVVAAVARRQRAERVAPRRIADGCSDNGARASVPVFHGARSRRAAWITGRRSRAAVVAALIAAPRGRRARRPALRRLNSATEGLRGEGVS